MKALAKDSDPVRIREIIRRNRAPDYRSKRYDILKYEPCLAFRARRKFRKDVVLSLEIGHRGHFADPVDDCPIRCVREMEDALSSVGAREGCW